MKGFDAFVNIAVTITVFFTSTLVNAGSMPKSNFRNLDPSFSSPQKRGDFEFRYLYDLNISSCL